MQTLPIDIYLTEQIKQFEQLAAQELKLTSHDLMQRAGAAVFSVLKEKWPQAKKIAVFCGKGHNGGDGYVVARLAHELSLDVEVWQVGDVSLLHNASLEAMQSAQAAGVKMQPWSRTQKISADVIVDALLGTGLHGEVKSRSAKAITAINESGIPILSIDIPSGIHANKGSVLGNAVQATATVTFVGLKAGLLTGQGIAHGGELHVDTLGLPSSFYEKVPVFARRMLLPECQHLLPPRERDAHKGKFGHVLVVGGDYSMPGAVLMAAEAAARVGAGLVSVATRPEHVKIIAETRPELMCRGVAGADELKEMLAKATVVIIGPGLGRSGWADELISAVLATNLPLVIDADGLNFLAEHRRHRKNWILTPHPGEAGRLLDVSSLQVQEDRYSALRVLHKRFSGVIVLKGAGTLVMGDDEKIWVCDAGNPGMASGGMGDLLAGIIGGVLAQGLSLEDAARMGVCLHAHAGDLASQKGERGMLAMDLMKYIRRLVNPPTL